MTVSDICRRPHINFGTFYLHYDNKFMLLDAIIDRVLDANPYLAPMPAAMCQRVPRNPEHLLLYRDPTVSPILSGRMIERGADSTIPEIVGRTCELEAAQCLVERHSSGGMAAVTAAVHRG